MLSKHIGIIFDEDWFLGEVKEIFDKMTNKLYMLSDQYNVRWCSDDCNKIGGIIYFDIDFEYNWDNKLKTQINI